MSSGAAVSAIVIFLNAEKFLAEAIASVFAQSEPGWELLLVDDGSTDGGSEIARRCAREHPGQVRCLEHPGHENRGMSASRNAGIRAARGEFVAFLDADDVWLPHKLSEQLAIARAHPRAGMICGATEYWWSWSDAKRENVVIPLGVALDQLHEPPQLSLSLYPLGPGAAPCPSDLMIRREVCARVGGFEEHFRHELQMYEDQAFLAKVYVSTPVYVSGSVWDRYRQHEESCVAKVTNAGRYHEVRRFFLQWLEKHLTAQKIEQPAVWRALQKALWRDRHPVLSALAGYFPNAL